MICNVCKSETRCYSLQESTWPPMRPMGMVFNICTACLGKLVSLIATDKTEIDNPDDYPIPENIMRKMQHMNERRVGDPAAEKHPIKIEKK